VSKKMTPQDYRERDATIYKLRVEEKKTLDKIANQFGLSRARIRQIIAKRERANAREERRKRREPMTPQDYRERDATIYKLRVEEKKTLDKIANQFGVCRERIRQIIAKRERADAKEERRKAMAPDTIGAMRLSLRLRNCLLNANWSESDRVISLLRIISMAEMMKIPNLGKKTIKELANKAEKVVGADVVQLWLNGKL
jgi:predicted transcriptional regulator